MIRRWVIRSFEKGETRERGHRAAATTGRRGCDPTGTRQADHRTRSWITVTDAAAATFLEGRKLCRAHGLLWSALDATAHWWQTSTSDWDATGWATGGGRTRSLRCATGVTV